MDKVWVLLEEDRDYDYDVTCVIGVFTTEDLAKASQKKMIRRRGRSLNRRSKEYTITDCELDILSG